MLDPLDAVQDDELRRQLIRLRANYFTTIDSERLGKLLRGFRSQKGIYKPSGSSHALWVRQTLRGAYLDQEPEYHPDGSWTYRYSPEGRGGHPDMRLDTNRALLQCQADRMPVGVMRQTPSERRPARLRDPGPRVRGGVRRNPFPPARRAHRVGFVYTSVLGEFGPRP